jgi:hypothetical protein
VAQQRAFREEFLLELLRVVHDRLSIFRVHINILPLDFCRGLSGKVQ